MEQIVAIDFKGIKLLPSGQEAGIPRTCHHGELLGSSESFTRYQSIGLGMSQDVDPEDVSFDACQLGTSPPADQTELLRHSN